MIFCELGFEEGKEGEERGIIVGSKSVITVADYSGLDLDEGNSTDTADSGSEVKSTVKDTKSVGDYELSDNAKKLAEERKDDGRAGTKITSVEEKAVGDVMWHTYSYYIKAGGWGKFLGE